MGSRGGCEMGSLSTWGRGVRGEARVSTIIWVVVFLAVVFAVIRFVPVRIDMGAISEFAAVEAKQVALRRYKCEKATERIINRSMELGMPLEPKNVKCEKLTTEIHITLEYTATFDFLIYKYEHDVKKVIKAPIINV